MAGVAQRPICSRSEVAPNRPIGSSAIGTVKLSHWLLFTVLATHPDLESTQSPEGLALMANPVQPDVAWQRAAHWSIDMPRVLLFWVTRPLNSLDQFGLSFQSLQYPPPVAQPPRANT